MKKIVRNIILMSGVVSLMSLTSCEDFLTLYPTDKITEQEFWQDRNDLESGLAACYYQMAKSDITNRIYDWGEFRATDNAALSDASNTSISNLQAGILRPTESMFDWAPFYTEINYCNKVIEHGQELYDSKKDVSLTSSVWNAYKSEAVAMRALTYFYLVRAYRNVPFVTKSISTDEEAMSAESQLPQTDGVIILSSMINDVEGVKNTPQRNLGNSVYNKGRITEKAIYALLADMRLWRACMLKHATDKASAGYIKDSLFNGINVVTKADSIVKADLQAAVDYSQKVIDLMNEEYDKENKNPITGEVDRVSDYPLYQQTSTGDGNTDMPYSYIFGSKNSVESIFELQYDATNQSNSAITNYIKSDAFSSISTMKVASGLYGSISSLNPSTGFGKTDIRAAETVRMTKGENSTYVLTKGIANNVSPQDYTDMSEGAVYSMRSQLDPNFIIYRLSDVMMIQAEALVRQASDKATMRKAFKLVVELFKRNNPGASKTSGDPNYIAWMTDNYVDNLSDDNVPGRATMLNYVYAERQREFVAEGKRWFDLVRMAEADNSTSGALELMGATKAVSSQLAEMMSFYNPVYSEELKANENLEQNPIWVNN